MAEANQHRIFLAFPGPTIGVPTAISLFETASRKHEVKIGFSPYSIENFNNLWCRALTEAEKGLHTHFAMLHSDVEPGDWWLDTLADEMDRLEAHIVSAVIPKKDHTGCCSCGVGDPSNPQRVWRAVTMQELFGLPETFNAADFGYPGYPLLFNHGCMLIDLRDGRFFRTDERGRLLTWFKFASEYGRVEDGSFDCLSCRSEDYWFAQQAHNLGANCYCTRKVPLYHTGAHRFSNQRPWGQWKVDEGNADLWRDSQKLAEAAA